MNLIEKQMTMFTLIWNRNVEPFWSQKYYIITNIPAKIVNKFNIY